MVASGTLLARCIGQSLPEEILSPLERHARCFVIAARNGTCADALLGERDTPGLTFGTRREAFGMRSTEIVPASLEWNWLAGDTQ